jgi:hypothetical protein
MKFRTGLATWVILAMHVSGCAAVDDDVGPPGEATVEQAALTDCSSLPTMAQMSHISTIDPEREMIIRDLKVVEDPCRTTWTAAGCASGTRGAWTFGQLMATMSGDLSVDGARARTFVNMWLRSWLVPQTNVNPERPQSVPPRPFIGGALLFKWLQASSCSTAPVTGQLDSNPAHWLTALQGCSLDLKLAPLRLLAIANRIDLDGRDYQGNGAPGELRFVYGVQNPTNPAAVTLNAEFILEYHFPNTRDSFSWAWLFHNLSGVDFAAVNPSFASQLQDITNMVVGPNAQPGNPNRGSSIAQIRTDENVFDSTAVKQWEFRQFGFRSCASPTAPCQLSQIPVDQTPPTSDNNTPALTTWLQNNAGPLATSHHVVPRHMLGASSLSPVIPNSTVWNTTGDPINGYALITADRRTSFNARHNFAFSTCNGCHYLETANTTELLFHISPRASGQKAQLSAFLNRTLAADPNDPGYPDINNKLSVPDPNEEGYDPFDPLYFDYNEIWRRACEIRRIFWGLTTPMSSPSGHM